MFIDYLAGSQRNFPQNHCMNNNRNSLSRTIGRVCTAVLLCSSLTAGAQESGKEQQSEMISFSVKEGLRAENAGQILASRLGLRAGIDELRSAYIEHPGEGLEVQRFNQYLNGVKVAHGTYTLTSKNGIASFAFGKFYPTAGIATAKPVLNEAAALAKALEFTRAEKYAWEDGSEEFPKASMTYSEDFTSGEGDGRLHLAYAFDVYAFQPLSRNMIYIDAADGKVLFVDAILKHVSATGSSLYSGTVAFNGGSISGTTYLHDSTRGSGIFTYDLNNSTSIPSSSTVIPATSAMQVTSATTHFTTDAAVDAHWGAITVYDYWKSAHNRNSWNGTNGALRSYVHYGANYNNAMWNGSSMIYGDGSGPLSGGFPPLTSLDVCAHEVGHGVCASTAGLVYSRESGAMNEGFSDIWGAVIEAYGDPRETDAIAKNTWLIGEELTNTLRSMSNPKQFGQPNCYLGTNWIYTGPGCITSQDNCGVHTNSGVLNFWFYLLTVGGQGTNDIDNPYRVDGIGMAKAAKIAYATELALTNTATYANCRTASIAAATTLYGACSPEVEAVTRAWYAVGVGANFSSCVPQISFEAPTSIVSEDASLADCKPSRIVTIPVSYAGPALTGGNASVTAVIVGGTAIQGVDYDLTSPTATFLSGSATPQSIAITVYDNGATKTNKYIDLSYTLASGGSNITSSVDLDTMRVTISDDDYAPYAGGSEQRNVLNYNVIGNTSSPFLSSAMGAHMQYLYKAKELQAAGIRPGIPLTAADFFVMTKYSSSAFQNYSVRLAHTPKTELSTGFVTSGFSTVFSDSVTTAIGWTGLPFSTPFIWNGTDNLVVDICFDNPGRITQNDRVQAQSGSYVMGAVVSSTFGAGCGLPLTVNNLVTSRPVIRFTQKTQVETALNASRTWEVKGGETYQFYSHGAKKLIASMSNASDSFGCVTTSVSAAGNGFVPHSGGSSRSVKEFLITPGRQLSSASFEAIFYLSNAELAGMDVNKVRIVQTNTTNDHDMRAGNTNFITPIEIINGMEYTGFRGNFTGFNRFFLTDGALALDVKGGVAAADALWTGANPFKTSPVLHWSLPAAERVSIRLFDITGKLVYSAEQTLASGRGRLSLDGHADYAPGSYVLQVVRPSGVFTRQLIKN